MTVLLFLFGEQLQPTLAGLSTDIKKVREYDRRARIDITHILLKYVPLGTSKQDALRLIKEQGLEINVPPIKKNDIESLGVINYSGGLIGWLTGFRDKYVIQLIFYNNRLTQVQAWIEYQAL